MEDEPEQLTVTGYRREGNQKIRLYSRCSSLRREHSAQLIPGTFQVRDPHKEVCGTCYIRRTREGGKRHGHDRN